MEIPKKKRKSRLTELREERQLTQKELADIIGVDPSTIANYEANNRSPKPHILEKIAKYLGQ